MEISASLAQVRLCVQVCVSVCVCVCKFIHMLTHMHSYVLKKNRHYCVSPAWNTALVQGLSLQQFSLYWGGKRNLLSPWFAQERWVCKVGEVE